MYAQKNWFGGSIHPTDEYIHWTENDPSGKAAELRAAYDAIVVSHPELKKHLEVLLHAAYASGHDDEIDSNSEDL